MQAYDLVVVGGGPAGAAAAWQAASSGARVLVCDKASFPRDKPCGDGLTPRAVQLVEHMGLGDQLRRRFHRVDAVRLVSNRHTIERPWPHQERGYPDHGYVVARTDLDEMLLRNAQAAGAEVREGVQATEPLVEAGVVRGVRVTAGRSQREDVRATLTVAADGMSSRIGRAAGLLPRARRPFAIAVRAQVDAERVEDRTLEAYMTLTRGRRLLPGYGWVFEMGSGRLNVGVGYVSTYKRWKELKINDLMADFCATLPASWKLPPVADMIASRRLQGWRLPMGLAVWPPWAPGLMAAGDAAGVAKPFTGVGISKAIQSGLLAARVAANVLSAGDPRELGAYQGALDDMWGAHYRLGRGFTTVVGKPGGMELVAGPVLRTVPTTTFLTKLMSHLQTERGGTMSDHLLRGLFRAAETLPAGSLGPVREPRVQATAAGDASRERPQARLAGKRT